MNGVNGKQMGNDEFALLIFVIAVLVGYVYYVYVYAPKKFRKKVKEIATRELNEESVEQKRRALLTLKEIEIENRELELRLKQKENAERVAANKAQDRRHESYYGPIVQALICPHCQQKAGVRRMTVTRVAKARVNSVLGKAVGIGTNTETNVTQLYCENCTMQWDI